MPLFHKALDFLLINDVKPFLSALTTVLSTNFNWDTNFNRDSAFIYLELELFTRNGCPN